jgi:hypothetical protein
VNYANEVVEIMTREDRDCRESALSDHHRTVDRAQQSKMQSGDVHAGEPYVGGCRAHDCEALIVMSVIYVFPSMTWMTSESCDVMWVNKQFVIVKSVVIIEKADLMTRMDFTSLCSNVR